MMNRNGKDNNLFEQYFSKLTESLIPDWVEHKTISNELVYKVFAINQEICKIKPEFIKKWPVFALSQWQGQ